MRFGPVETLGAEGVILAHGAHRDDLLMKKGRRLSREDVAALAAAGIEEVVAARLEPGDIGEDPAATAVALQACGAGLIVEDAFTGRVNLHAAEAGVLLIDTARVDALNRVDEAVTIATLPAHAAVQPGTMVATIKIIPFAVPEDVLTRCREAMAGGPLLRLAPFQPRKVRLIQTRLPGTSPKMLDKTVRVTAERVEAVGGTWAGETRCAHDAAALAAAIASAAQAGFDILLIAGASAITDRRDVLPAGIEQAGGRALHFGMPVDPGNLLLLAELDGRPVLGLPGCARSPKLNGFDWVLQRLAAGLEVGRPEIMGMGVGGLLMEIPTRPQPRDGRRKPLAAAPRKVAAVLLAAGQSRRMGGPNKLLASIDGRPMVAHAAEAALASSVQEVVVVTGHERERIETALQDLAGPRLRFVHNPDHGDGLSTSVRTGLGALAADVEGAVVLLGDMPRVRSDLVEALLGRFAPVEGPAIVVPTRGGKRGNPVLWGRAFWPAIAELQGDVGARHLIGENAPAVIEVEVADDAALLDIDTPEALARLGTRSPPDAAPPPAPEAALSEVTA